MKKTKYVKYEVIGVYTAYIIFCIIGSVLVLYKFWPYNVIFGIVIGCVFGYDEIKHGAERDKYGLI